MPVLRAAPSPWLRSCRITVAPACAAARPVSSVEQSSTTITSAAGRGRWASALRTARAVISGRL
jgi:hypothetical protein